MSELTDRLKENRGDAIAECQRLLDGAKAEDRDLTEPERRIFDDHEETARLITERLEDITERNAAAERSGRMFDTLGIPQAGAPERDYRGGDLTRQAIRTVEDAYGLRRRQARAGDADRGGRQYGTGARAAPLTSPAVAAGTGGRVGNSFESVRFTRLVRVSRIGLSRMMRNRSWQA